MTAEIDVIKCLYQNKLIKKVQAVRALNFYKHDGVLTCDLCGLSKPTPHSIDHIISWHNNGGSDLDNLQLTHSICNSVKGRSIDVEKEPFTNTKRLLSYWEKNKETNHV